MCFPILYSQERPASRRIDKENDLIPPKDPTFIDRPGSLYHLPALRRLGGIGRCLRKRVAYQGGRRYYH